MQVLVIGCGAREHALVLGLLADQAVTQVHCAPGNAGIATCAMTHPVDVLDPHAVAELADRLSVDLVVIGPEGPLVLGRPTPSASVASRASGPRRQQPDWKAARPSPRR